MRKILTVITGVLLSASLLVGCGTNATSGSGGSSEVIKVGSNFELSGANATFGKSSVNGIDLAFEQQNAKGGVLGKKLLNVSADNKSDAGESTAAVTKLIGQDKVVAILGSYASTDTLAASQVATDSKIPLLSPTSTNVKVTVENGQVKPWIFRACFIDPFQGEVAAKFALNNLKAKTAAVFIDQKSDYSKGLAEAFISNFKKGNGTIVDTEQYVASSDKDFRATLTRAKSANPDYVFIPGYYQEVGLIVKQAREMGMKQPMMGGDGWDSPDLLKIAGADALNNTYFVNMVAIDDPAMASFVKEYKAKYNIEPDAMAALAYDAANMLIKAFETAGDTNGEKVRTALENMKGFKGLSGETNIDPKTHNPVKSAVIIEMKNGKNTFLTKVEPN